MSNRIIYSKIFGWYIGLSFNISFHQSCSVQIRFSIFHTIYSNGASIYFRWERKEFLTSTETTKRLNYFHRNPTSFDKPNCSQLITVTTKNNKHSTITRKLYNNTFEIRFFKSKLRSRRKILLMSSNEVAYPSPRF